MIMNNKLNLELTDNPDLQEIFKGRSVGDKVRLEVDFTIDELTDDVANGTVDEVAATGSAPESETETPDVGDTGMESPEPGNESIGLAVQKTMGGPSGSV
jgi:hypothetical protein